MSYQSTEEDALSIMKTAYEHHEPGGIFLYDFWHGPGDMRELPSRRESELKDAATLLTRVAVPELRVNDNIVIVNYTVNITDLKSGQTARLYESHTLRYWFLPELRNLARQAGFTVIGEGGWMRLSPPELSDWNAWMACGK
jgi:hypothetical protein